MSLNGTIRNNLFQKSLQPSGMFRTRDFEALGYSRQQVKRLADRGEIERLGRGLYRLPGAELTQHHSLAEVCKRVPQAAVCLSSALQFHNLTTQSPVEVWILLERTARTPSFDYPPLRVFRASGEALTAGIEEHLIEGVTMRVTNIAKTVADCFKYRNKIGLDIAIEALKESLRRDPHTGKRPSTREDLRRYARICRVERVMQPYLEALS
jgi:predicted transcriptional regulator of viral defense system